MRRAKATSRRIKTAPPTAPPMTPPATGVDVERSSPRATFGEGTIDPLMAGVTLGEGTIDPDGATLTVRATFGEGIIDPLMARVTLGEGTIAAEKKDGDSGDALVIVIN